MRRLLGLLILLYGLLLALNTAAPSVAELAGDKVSAVVDTAGCGDALGSPPFGGLYGTCPAQLSDLDGGLKLDGDGGHVFGYGRAGDVKVGTTEVYRYPFLDDYAVLPPSNSDQVAAIVALLIIVVGISLLVAERRHHRRRSSSSDSDSDSDWESDSDDSSDGGGSDGGGDGGGGGD